MECAVVSIGLAAIGIIMALRTAFRASARVDLLERQVRSLENQLWVMSHRQAEGAAAQPEPEPAQAAAEESDEGSTVSVKTAPGAPLPPPLPAPFSGTGECSPATAETGIFPPIQTSTERLVESLVPAEAAKVAILARVASPEGVSEGTASPSAAGASAEGFERNFTTRIAIWLGAIALFLAGAFFVKYTFDAGLLGPAVRIVLGAAFGLVLIGAGEWMRRRGDTRIGEGLTAAGVADLYAVTLAALNLYHFVGPTIGFILLAVITAAAIGLSLRQGPFVALLGLVGGFATPALIGSEDPRPGPLFVYLLLLQGGIAGISRTRGWWPLSLLAFVGGVAWVFIWLLTARGSIDGAWLAGFVLLSLPVVLGTIDDSRQIGPVRARGLGALAGIVSMFALGAVINVSGFTATDWGFLALLGAGAIVAARIDARHEPLPWLALALTGILLIVWKLRVGAIDGTIFPWVCLGTGVLYSGGGYAAIWGAKTPGRFAALSCAGALLAFLVAYGALAEPPLGLAWGLIASGIAAAFAVAAAPLTRAETRAHLSDEPLAAMLAGATAFVSLAVAVEFERRLIPVAWAIEAPLLALLFARLRVELLRALSAGLAGLAILGLVLPDVFAIPIGTTPIWNWLLYAYGVPTIALAAAAWVFHRIRDPHLSRAMQAGAALLAFLLVTTETRHFFHREALISGDSLLTEVASYVSVWLVLALAATALARGATRAVAEGAAKTLAVLALVVAGVGLLVGENPLWKETTVGEWILLNDLLWSYGVPAGLLIALAIAMRRWEPLVFSSMLAVGGVVLLFALVSLEVRHVFHRDVLLRSRPELTETATYVVAWLSLSLIAVAAARGAAREIAEGTSRALAVLALVLAAGGLLLAQNPLWNAIPVGETRLWNRLLPCYGLPAALLIALAYAVRKWPPREFAGALVLGGIVLLFALVNLEVRQWFRGDVLTGSWPTGAELYAYSAAWTVFGLALLGAGVATGSAIARWASLVVMFGVVGKVFLGDLAGLRDLYRVFSLLGLGLSLMLLALIYQRFVFPRITPKPAA
ncbi:MAG: DUF2339 domain-containing protein [Phycisphaerales bacterium]|nr:DUF2339 domain-containing protein [Phycisphaerales bacterium]